MRFLCQHCKSKYTISDEKIRNKRLKIRCKKCNNIIEIIDPHRSSRRSSLPASPLSMEEPVSLVLPDPDEPGAVATDSLEDQFAASFKTRGGTASSKGTPGLYDNLSQQAATLSQDDAEQAIWFVALDNVPVGPVSARVVHRHKQAGRVDDDTLTWKEGMPDWSALRTVKELIGLLARIDLEKSTSEATGGAAHSPRHRLDLYGTEEDDGQAPLKGAQVGVIGARQPGARGGRPGWAPPWADGSGAPEDALSDETEREGEFETEVSRLHSLTPPRLGGSRVYLLASVGFFITALVTLIIVITGGGEATGETQSSVQTVEKIVEKVVYRDRIVEKEVYKDETEEASATQKSAPRRQPAAVAAKTKRAQPKKATDDDRTRELMERLSLNAPEGRAPIGGSRSTRNTDGAGGSGGSVLTSNQMKRVVNQNKGALKSCYERSLKKGEASDSSDLRVNFKLTVGKSGMVKQVGFGGEGANLPTLKSCLSRSVKQWVFPPSSGDSSLEFPFVFTPTK